VKILDCIPAFAGTSILYWFEILRFAQNDIGNAKCKVPRRAGPEVSGLCCTQQSEKLLNRLLLRSTSFRRRSHRDEALTRLKSYEGQDEVQIAGIFSVALSGLFVLGGDPLTQGLASLTLGYNLQPLQG